MDEKEFYIFGIPVKTDLCEVRFFKYHEYIENLSELSMMSLNVLHIYYQYKKMNIEKDKEFDEMLEELKKDSLFNIVRSQSQFSSAYYKIFKLVIEEDDVIAAIMDNEDVFMEYRQLVMDMNMLQEEEVSHNPEIQKSLERSRRVKQQTGEKQTYMDIVSSIVAGTSNSFNDVVNMTVLQVYSTYYRMSAIMNYNTTALFATVSDKVSIDQWNKHIDLWHKESHTIDKDAFKKKFGDML